MLIYGVAFITSVLFAYLCDVTTRQLQNRDDSHVFYRFLLTIFCVLSALPLILISGLRGDVGIDKSLYTREFLTIAYDSGGYVHSDFGFQILNKAVAFFSKNSMWLYIILAIIFIAGVYALAATFSSMYAFIVVLLFATYNYFQSLSLIAQFTAIGILCFGIRAMLKQHWMLSLVWVALASTCHLSAAIFFPVIGFCFLLQKANSPIRIFCSILIIIGILSIFASFVIPLIVRKTRYSVYLTMYDYSNLSSTSMILINITVLLFMFGVFFYRKDVRDDATIMILLIIQFVAVCLSLAQNQVNLLVRVVMYFSFFQIYSIPVFCRLIKSFKCRVFISLALITFMMLWVFIYPIMGNYYSVFPYEFICMS